MDIAGTDTGGTSFVNSPDPAPCTAKDAVAAVALAAVPKTTLPRPSVAVAGTVVVMLVPALLAVNAVSAVPILTDVTLDSPVPVMVTVAPTRAEFGETVVMTGTGGGSALTVRVTN